MSLYVNEIAAVLGGRRAPEMSEADVIQRRGGLKARDVASQRMRFLVGLDHRRERVPSDDRADTPFDFAITGIVWLAIDRDSVHIRRVGVVGKIRAARARFVEEILDEKMRAVDAF